MVRFIVAFMVLFGLPVQASDIFVQHSALEFTPFENEFIKVLSVEELKAEDDRFGGISALARDGDTAVLALSDRGDLLVFDALFSRVRISPLLAENGKIYRDTDFRDAESLSLGADGEVLVSFEREHRVDRYTTSGRYIGSYKPSLPDLSSLPHNGGLEAIESLQDGRLVLISEEGPKDGAVPMWVEQPDGAWQRFDLPVFNNYKPTGLARLPGSDQMILLERFFSVLSGLGIRISELDPITGKRGALLADFPGGEWPLDNFEGIMIDHDDTGRTVITMISDDNFNLIQRTLLMKLEYKN